VGDSFGWAVSLSANGTSLAIGAIYNDGNGNDSGHVRVYNFDADAGSWTQIGEDIDGEAAGDWLGYSVSLSADGTVLAIGAIYNDGIGNVGGHVRVYKFDNTSRSWSQIGDDINGEALYDSFGSSVSLSADGAVLAVGAWANSGNGDFSGHVRVFGFQAEEGWTQIGNDIDGEAADDASGWSVSVSADGAMVAVGADENDGNGDNSGHVRVFHFDPSTSDWMQVGQDLDGEVAGDHFGYSISLSADGTRLAIGANRNDGNGSDSGHVRVYDIASVCLDKEIVQRSSDGGQKGAFIGICIAVVFLLFVAGLAGRHWWKRRMRRGEKESQEASFPDPPADAETVEAIPVAVIESPYQLPTLKDQTRDVNHGPRATPTAYVLSTTGGPKEVLIAESKQLPDP